MARINPGRMMVDDGGGYEPLIAVAVQAAVASPAVVNTPANVAPKAAEVEKVVTAVIKAVAPDDSDDRLRQIARQATQAVVTNPAVIAAPAGQTVNTTTVQGIIAASVKMPYDSKNPATTTTMPFDGTTTPSVKNLDTTTVTSTASVVTPTPSATVVEKPDPTKTAYADLTPAQRAAMSSTEKTNYLRAAREFKMAGEATERAASNPMFDFANRPEAPKKAGMIQYYSWIGDSNSGSWKLYSAVDTPANQEKYGSRSTGGATQATAESPVGANALATPSTWDPKTNTWKPATTTPATTTATTTAATTTPTTTTATTTTPTTTTPTTTITTTPTTNDPTFTSPVVDPNAPLVRKLQEQIDALKKQAADAAAGTSATQYNDRTSVYATMADRFNKYGLSGLANKIKELAMQGATEATITLQLQDTPEYQQRFAANADRIKKGLAALTPAEYVNVEDSYRQVLRAYGLKQFDNDAYVKQFISNDMSPTELSNRVVTAVQRVQNADPAILSQLKQYYGIGAPDMVAYVLDPEQQFQKIERQIAASEIGVAAGRQGLTAGVSVAEQLAAQGVTEAQAQKGYATIADILPTAEKLSDIYGTTLEGYRQAEGEQEVFNSLASAQRKRQKLSAREIAAFSGSSGTNKASLTTSNVGKF
jgi:hypothetical protein